MVRIRRLGTTSATQFFLYHLTMHQSTNIADQKEPFSPFMFIFEKIIYLVLQTM